MRSLYHIITKDDWKIVENEEFYRPSSLVVEGFIHCSFKDQVSGTWDKHFSGLEDLLVLTIDPDRVGSRVVVENLTGAQMQFPHIYGPLPRIAVVKVEKISDFSHRK